MGNSQENMERSTSPPTEVQVDDELTVDGILQSLINGATLGDIVGITQEQREALYTMGHFHCTQGRYKDAINFFRFLLFYDQWEIRAIFGLGCCLQMLGQFEQAQLYLGLTVMMEPTNPASGVQFAECLLLSGKKAEAINILDKLRSEFGIFPQHEALMRKVDALLQFSINSSIAEPTDRSE